jgi:hypothetical protein
MFDCCSPDVRVYAYAAAQVKKAMEVWMIILFSHNPFILLLMHLSCGLMLCDQNLPQLNLSSCLLE